MAYTITITYKGVEKEIEGKVVPICRYFSPDNSYIDTPVFKEGYPQDADAADKNYGKSVYATNVEGWGELGTKDPYDTTSIPMPVPMAQFKMAAMAEDNKFVFEVEDYREAMYYAELGRQMADQGFDIQVKKA